MGFLKKIFQKIKKKEESPAELEFKAKKEEDDIVFVRKFKEGNGVFFYCETKEEALEYLQNILVSKDINEVLCLDDRLTYFLEKLDCNHYNQVKEGQDIAFLKCEFLVALDGSIMISSDQTYHVKKADLPKKIIIWAHPEQIIESSSIGLAKIRYNKKDHIPSNITSLHGTQVQGFASESSAKELYLLLVEESI